MLRSLALGALLSVCISAADSLQIRPLDLPLAGLLKGKDMSTPEAAYGVITQLMITGQGDWKVVSASRMAAYFAGAATPMVPPQMLIAFQQARLVEVQQVANKASVIAALPNGFFDVRHLEKENNRWLNIGEDGARNLEEARQLALKNVATALDTTGRTLDLPMEQVLTRTDMNTPEGAFGVITKLMIEGGDWRPVSVAALANKKDFQKPSPPMPGSYAKLFRQGRVVEVQQLGAKAAVIAALADGNFDIRFLELEQGRWLNRGENMAPTLPGARKNAQNMLGVPAKKAAPITNPDAHLAKFVQYVKTAGRDPKAFLLEALATHRLTILGETHNRPLYWDFNAQLVADPAFPKMVGTIYLELSASHQGHMDRFLAVPTLDTAPLVEMLRDTHVEGWPGKSTVDFLTAVWKVNQTLDSPQRIRVVLVDNLREWTQVKAPEDWLRFMRGRDATMAQNILKDLLPGDGRNGLFITGRLHVELNYHIVGRPNAGTLLRQALKDQAYVVVQHCLVQEDGGKVHGRARGGLFDEAFQKLKDAPVAFPLAGSPFGAEPYDGHPELEGHVEGTYGSCFDAYLYLGPLEKELRSPLIPGFYTDAFMPELERRFQALMGTSLAKAYRLSSLDAKAYTKHCEKSWGKAMWPRGLGPVDAWRK